MALGRGSEAEPPPSLSTDALRVRRWIPMYDEDEDDLPA
jgi:hypothetical protein